MIHSLGLWLGESTSPNTAATTLCSTWKPFCLLIPAVDMDRYTYDPFLAKDTTAGLCNAVGNSVGTTQSGHDSG